MHGFRDNEVLLQAGYDVIVIPPPGVALRYFTYGFWKGDHDFIFMFNWHFLSILNGLEFIQHFVFGWYFPTWSKILVFLGKMNPKTSNERKTLAGRALPFAKLRLLSHCAWNYLYPFGMCRCARKKGRKEEKSQVYISHMCGATPSGRIPTKLGTCDCLTDVIKCPKFHRYNLRGFGAVRCGRFHVAIGNQGRP